MNLARLSAYPKTVISVSGNSFESGNNRPNIVPGQHFSTDYQAQHDFLVGKVSAQPKTFNTGAFSDSGAVHSGQCSASLQRVEKSGVLQ